MSGLPDDEHAGGSIAASGKLLTSHTSILIYTFVTGRKVLMRKVQFEPSIHLLWLVAVIIVGLTHSPLCAQPSATNPGPATNAAPTNTPTRYHASRFPKRAGEYYGLGWGIDSLSVKAVESGALIRFAYHVLDPQKAKSLNDKNLDAFLNSPEHHIQLVIPSLEKVGKLRQSGDPEPGRTYWMAFSNPHRVVKHGDRVNVVIGQFHANGLVVE